MNSGVDGASARGKPSAEQLSDAELLAIRTIGWTLADDDRAARLLALTGLEPAAIKAGLEDRAIQVAVLDFLANHEPDLIEAADGMGVPPENLMAARALLSK